MSDSLIYALNPKLWLDARYVAGADGASVGTWLDRSGSGLNATQAGANKPTIRHGVTGLGDAVRFDGISQALQITTCDLTATQAITVLIALQSTQIASAILLEMSDTYGSYADSFGVVHGNGAIARLAGGLQGNVNFSQQVTDGEVLVSLVAGFVLDKAQASGSEAAVYVNGVVPAVTTTLAAENTNNFGNRVLNVGARNNGASLPFAGDIAHLILFPRALSAAEILAASEALAFMTGVV